MPRVTIGMMAFMMTSGCSKEPPHEAPLPGQGEHSRLLVLTVTINRMGNLPKVGPVNITVPEGDATPFKHRSDSSISLEVTPIAAAATNGETRFQLNVALVKTGEEGKQNTSTFTLAALEGQSATLKNQDVDLVIVPSMKRPVGTADQQ